MASPKQKSTTGTSTARLRLVAREVAAVAVPYLFAWWGLLWFPSAVFWDDWALYGVTPEEILGHFRQVGSPHIGYFHLFFVQFQPGAARVVAGVLGLVIAVLVSRILLRLPGARRDAALWATALTAAFPLFASRVALINLPSLVGLSLFLLGWLLVTTTKDGHRVIRLMSASAFFVAATLLYPTFAVMVIAPVLHLAWLAAASGLELARSTMLAWGIAIAFVTSLAFLAARLSWRPSGTYAGYQSLVFSVWTASFAIAFLILVSLWFLSVLRQKESSISILATPSAATFLFGLVLCALAYGPYIAMGAYPPYVEWQSRYNVNLGIGAAALLMPLMQTLLRTERRRRFQLLLKAVSIATAILATNFSLLGFLVDARKHEALSHHFSQLEVQLDGKFVLVRDTSRSLNAWHRDLRFYEWSGILSASLGTTSVFATATGLDTEPTLKAYNSGELSSQIDSVYNHYWKNHSFPSNPVLVVISQTSPSCGLFGQDMPRCLTVTTLPLE